MPTSIYLPFQRVCSVTRRRVTFSVLTTRIRKKVLFLLLAKCDVLTQVSELPLKAELIESLKRMGITVPTEVQEKALQPVLDGKDVIVRSKTGTGKTLAFLVPIMQRLHKSNEISAIVLVPTRELAVQVAEVAKELGSHMHIRSCVVYGGASINVQMEQLARGVDIVVGTPGRVIDLMSRGALDLQDIRFVVLDEADRMLDMGFENDIQEILVSTPQERQTMLFSAVMPREIAEIATHYMKHDHVKIVVGKEEEIVVNTITHNYAFIQGRMKFAALLGYIDAFSPKKCIIFANTQREAEMIHGVLRGANMDVMLLHGGLTQAKRERALDSFREGARFMIATNVAARGLDIDNITDIINFDAPEDVQNYVNRVGRSARMGKEGRALTFIGNEERELMRTIQQQANITLHELSINYDAYRNIELPQRDGFRRFGGNRPYGQRRDSHDRGGFHNREHGRDHSYGNDNRGGRPGGGFRGHGRDRRRHYGNDNRQPRHDGQL